MITAERPVELKALAMDELLQLQLSVAQRADELARGVDFTRARDMLIWFQAEREIFGKDHAQRPMSMQQPSPAENDRSRIPVSEPR